MTALWYIRVSGATNSQQSNSGKSFPAVTSCVCGGEMGLSQGWSLVSALAERAIMSQKKVYETCSVCVGNTDKSNASFWSCFKSC